jgi:hypothetical protein
MDITLAPGETLTVTCVDAPRELSPPTVGQSLGAYATEYYGGVNTAAPEWPTDPDGAPLDPSMVWAGEGWIPSPE